MEFEKSEKTGYILQEEGHQIVRRFAAVRAALSWPRLDLNLRGYFCVLGEEVIGVPHFEDNVRRRGKIYLLHEWLAPDIHTSMEDLFIELIAAAAHYKFETVYGAREKYQGEDFTDHTNRFQNFVYSKEARLWLQQAPLADNLGLSVDIVNTWKRKSLLEIPENSIARKEMDMLQATDLSRLGKEFSAANAVRFAVCGFNANPPRTPSDRNWRAGMPEGSWKSL